jgi:cupin 2 domain-containing protein
MPQPVNLFADIPSRLPEELIEVIHRGAGVRIERIVSRGHASPEGFWFDQNQDEWVFVLRGAARLGFDEQEPPVEMRAGDFLLFPAHKRHRVEWTSSDEPTIWLAVHIDKRI